MEYTTPGTYTVRISATDNCGNKKEDTRTIIVKDRPVTLTFETNGGSAIAPELVEKGTTYDLSEVKPTKTDWLFDGWFDNASLAGAPITSILMDQDYTVYAKWVEERYATYVFSKASNNTVTLAINVPETQLEDYKSQYGVISATYEPWTEDAASYAPSSANQVLWKDFASRITDICIASSITPYTMQFWFAGFTNAERFTGGSRIDGTELRSLESTFYNCTKLDNVDLMSLRTPKVTSMKSTFQGCKSFNNWNLQLMTTPYVQDFSYCFADVKVRNHFGSGVFEKTNYLLLNTWSFASATKTTSMFSFLDAREIYFNTSLGQVQTANVTNFNSMFSNMQVEAIYSPRFLADSMTSDTYMFGNSLNLIGGAGTVYDPYRVDVTMAHPDGAGGAGYFRGTVGVTITYDSNGGSYIDPETVKTGELHALPVPTLAGKVLDGWYTDPTGGTKVPNPYRPNTDITLYAHWRDPVPEGTHYLFTDGTLMLGLPAEEVPAQVAIHGPQRNSYTNDPSAARSIFYSNIAEIKNVVCGSPMVELEPKSYAFEDAVNLESADLSCLVPSTPETTFVSTFENCQLLTSVYLNMSDTSNITNVHAMFKDCINLPAVTLPNLTVVGDVGSMFKNCQRLSTLDLSPISFAGVNDMSYMCQDCISLSQVEFASNVNTSRVEHMEYVFDNCQSLANITNLGKVSTAGAYYITGMFKQTACTVLDCSGFDTTHVRSLSGVFSNCQALRTIYGTDAFIYRSGMSSTSGLFANCPLLEGGRGTRWNSAHASDGDYLWIDGRNGRPGYITGNGHEEAYAYYDSSTKTLHFFRDDANKYTNWQVIGTRTYFTGIESTTLWGAKWTTDCKENCLHITMSSEKINIAAAEELFSDFAQVQDIDISNMNFSGIIMDHMFFGTENLSSLTITSAWDTSHVQSAYAMFAASGITDSAMESFMQIFDASSLTNASAMFQACRRLEHLNLSRTNWTALTHTANMFAQSRLLQQIKVSTFDNTTIDEDSDMFLDCTSLVGCNGTAYNANRTDKTYARIDRAGTPGYFTQA